MAYKAVFTQVSEVDSNGRMVVSFDIRKGATVLYPNFQIEGLAADIPTLVTNKANELAAQIREQKKLKVGDSIDIVE